MEQGRFYAGERDMTMHRVAMLMQASKRAVALKPIHDLHGSEGPNPPIRQARKTR